MRWLKNGAFIGHIIHHTIDYMFHIEINKAFNAIQKAFLVDEILSFGMLGISGYSNQMIKYEKINDSYFSIIDYKSNGYIQVNKICLFLY